LTAILVQDVTKMAGFEEPGGQPPGAHTLTESAGRGSPERMVCAPVTVSVSSDAATRPTPQAACSPFNGDFTSVPTGTMESSRCNAWT
jgi:hypothetical protein